MQQGTALGGHGLTPAAREDSVLGDRSEIPIRVAKLAPETERLAGHAAPDGKHVKADLGWARSAHQTGSKRRDVVLGLK